MFIIFIFRNEQDDINIDIIPYISMANKSSWSMPQNSTEDCSVPPDSIREGSNIPIDNSDDSFENDIEQEENSKMPINPKVVRNLQDSFDLLSEGNGTVQPDHKEHFCKSRRTRIPLPRTPLETSLHNLEISDSSTIQLPAYSQDTEENIDDYEQINEQLSSLGGHKKIDFALPGIEDPQKKSLALTITESKTAAQKDNQDGVQGDKLSDESEGYVIEQIDFESPVTTKIQSSYLEILATSGGTVNDDDDDKSEYYEWYEVEQMQNLSAIAPNAATTRPCVLL